MPTTAEQRFAELAGTSAEQLLALDPRRREAVLAQLEHGGSRRVARELARMLEAGWWAALDLEDAIRAARVVAHMSACADGSPREPAEPCRRTILDNTLDSLLPPHGCFVLVFEDLPIDGEDVVAGACRAPATVILNRRVISSEDLPLGRGRRGALEARAGLATLVHEVNHLHNHLHNLTPPASAHEAFQDEYRAWYVDFVAQVARAPRRVEALERCRELLTSPSYAALGEAVQQGTADGERILAFMRAFGPVSSLEDVLALRRDEFLAAAPLPEPPGNMSNAVPEPVPAIPS